MTNSKDFYSVIIPVYNSDNVLKELVNRISDVFISLKLEYEIIFVNDGSPNKNTWLVLEELVSENDSVKAIQLTRNFGQQAATLCGLNEAKGNFVITMDDDLQHRPEDIPKLIAESNHDIVIGKLIKKKHNVFKKITSKMKGWLDYILLGKPKKISLSSFRLLNKSTVRGMLQIKTPYPFIPALMFYTSKDVVNVVVSHDKRKEGKSNYSLRKMIKLFSNLLINNSNFFLKLIGFFGITISLLSFCIGIYLVIKKIIYNSVATGWTSVIVSILFIGGLVLFSIGIIGEYLIRIIHTTEHKPSYIIKNLKSKK